MILSVILFVASLVAAPVPTKVSERFGFDPEDSTAQLQAALDSGLPEITIDRKNTPWVTRPLFVRSNQRIVFEKGVELIAKRDAFAGKNDRLLALVAVTNVTLVGENAVLSMWAEDYADRKKYAKSEHRHAIGLYGCANVTVQGLTLARSGGDGIYIGDAKPQRTPCRDIVIRSCVCDGNRRQGISVISAENLLIEDCVLKNTRGTAPKDGIDFEPNQPFNLFVNCRVRNCTFERNAGYALEFALQHSDATTVPCDIVVENCRSTGDLGAVKMRTRVGKGGRPTGRILLKDCNFAETVSVPVWIIQNPEKSVDVRFESCTIDRPAAARPDLPIVLLDAPFPADARPARPVFTNLTVTNAGNRPETAYDWFGGGLLVPMDFTKPAVVDPTPGEMTAGSTLAIRHHARLVIYAEGPKTVTLKCHQFNRKDAHAKFVVTDLQASVTVAELPLPGFVATEVSFAAPARGFYALETMLGKGALVLDGANVPVALDCSGKALNLSRWGREEAAANFQGTAGEVYLPLRAGQTGELRFAGMGQSEKVAVRVTRPDGSVEFEKGDVMYWTRHTIRPLAADGLLKISFAKPANGLFEDFRFGLRGLPALVFLTPGRYWHDTRP